ncbi:uncharacterized protein LOC119986897 [Tripterygium wilfordii]|uniref:uncharacterized protein LOC119986897 n=1 Tax=Tripterygium wilfordii TaxID=458696 RepID=UPI0018F8620F|nr:uncharacterized protein LOC119986897 [Tripterygium wilfordii]
MRPQPAHLLKPFMAGYPIDRVTHPLSSVDRSIPFGQLTLLQSFHHHFRQPQFPTTSGEAPVGKGFLWVETHTYFNFLQEKSWIEVQVRFLNQFKRILCYLDLVELPSFKVCELAWSVRCLLVRISSPLRGIPLDAWCVPRMDPGLTLGVG